MASCLQQPVHDGRSDGRVLEGFGKNAFHIRVVEFTKYLKKVLRELPGS